MCVCIYQSGGLCLCMSIGVSKHLSLCLSVADESIGVLVHKPVWMHGSRMQCLYPEVGEWIIWMQVEELQPEYSTEIQHMEELWAKTGEEISWMQLF